MITTILKHVKYACSWTIALAYKQTNFHEKDALDRIFLNKPTLYKPSADGHLLLEWHEIFNRINNEAFPNDLKKACIDTVEIVESKEKNFNFGKIQSMTSSKGFGMDYNARINGSWFKDVTDWGKAMYPADNLSGLDEGDFQRNIKYTEITEGFTLDRTLNVHYLSWLDRFIGQQSGGSHHAAMLIHQINNQNREYKRDIVLTTHTLNESHLKAMSEKYYMFVTSETGFCPAYSDVDTQIRQIFREYVCDLMYTILDVNCCAQPVQFVFINKYDLKVNIHVFDQWYEKQVKRGVIIPLLSLLSDTKSYCNEPYLHECKTITLGDYYRTNDLLVKEK